MDQVNSAKPLSTTILGQHLLGVEVRGHPLLQFGVYGHELRDVVVNRIQGAREQGTTSTKPSALGTLSNAVDNMSLSSGSTALEKDKDSFIVSSPGDMTPQSDDPEWLSSLTSPPNTINSDATLFSQRTLSASPPPCDQKPVSDECKNAVTAKLAPLSHSIEFVRSHEVPTRAFSMLPKPINIPRDLLRGMASRHFVCLTIGSRGDVQYV